MLLIGVNEKFSISWLLKRIKTTDAKAKELRGFVERLVTYAKKGDIIIVG